MVLLSASRISKTFGDKEVLREVDVELRSGDHVALVGPNGTGKTTLLRILTSEMQSDGGQVGYPTKGTVGYLQQHPTFEAGTRVWDIACQAVGDLSKLAEEAEQIASKLATSPEGSQEYADLLEQLDRIQAKLQQKDAYNWEHRVERILQGLGFTNQWHQREAAKLSGGQQNRLMLACLLLQQPDLMILDEPNNHLDIESTEWLESTLADWPGAFLLVSHDRFFLDRTANAVLELVDGKLDRFKGNYSAYVKQKAERLEVQRRTYEKNREEIAKLEDFIRKHHHGMKSAQAEDRRKKLERIELVEPPREIVVPKFHFPKATRTGDIVIRARNLKQTYDKLLFEKLSVQVQRGERWAVLGSNGSGKSTLVKCLLGELQPEEGEVELGHKLRVGYFDQLLAKLPTDTTAAEAIRVPHRDLDDRARRDILGAFGLSGDLATQPLRKLSGGERNRTMLAWLCAMEANVLVLDEPTNHLDLWSRHALEAAIKDFDGTVILVSHDRYLVNAIADHILVLSEGRASQVAGNYDAYLHWQKEGLAVQDRGQIGGATKAAANQTDKSTNKSAGSGLDETSNDSAKQPRRKRKFPYRKVADLEKDIEGLETEIEKLHEAMSEPNNLRDGRKMKELQEQLAERESKLMSVYEHYEESCELN
ncbi:MAG: ABC-F family ATP-binding cassette domain-containing protein [Planctomycetota bacterium]